MENNKKETFDSLKNRINLYSDAVEILENIQLLYKSYFNFEQNKLINRNDFSIDCGTNIIKNYKNKGLFVFNEILLSNPMKVQWITNLLSEENLFNLDKIEKVITQKLDLFLKICYIEAKTYLDKNGPMLKKQNYYLDMNSIDNIKTSIERIISMIIEINQKAVTKKLYKEIQVFNKKMEGIEKDIESTLLNKINLDKDEFMEKIFLLRDRFLDNIENFKYIIENLLVNEFLVASVRSITLIIESEIHRWVDKYKNLLNKYFIEEMTFTKGNVKWSYNYNNECVEKLELYGKCKEVLNFESENLRLIEKTIVDDFNITKEEIDYDLESVVYNEFYSLIYHVKSEEDLKTMSMAIKEKGSYFINNLILNMLGTFSRRYNNNIVSKISNRSEIISKLYLFKPIDYRGNFITYNCNVIVDLQRNLYKLYNGYDFKSDIYNKLNKIPQSQETLIEEIKYIIKKYIYDYKWIKLCENKSKEELIEFNKNRFCRNIYSFKKDIYVILNREFTYNFNYLHQYIIKDIEGLELKIEGYKE